MSDRETEGRAAPRGPHRWVKGESGNPRGMSKASIAARAFEGEARRQALAALTVLGKIVENEKQPSTARIAAAQALMERAWGAPKPRSEKSPWRKYKKKETAQRPIIVVPPVMRDGDGE